MVFHFQPICFKLKSIAIFFWFSVTILCPSVGFGQDPPAWRQPNITAYGQPPKPTEIVKADLGVNHLTGSPSLSIPLFEISAPRLKENVSLSYQSQGLKPHQVAGVVGQGWSLNTGGAINRSMQGKPDDVPLGFFNSQNRARVVNHLLDDEYWDTDGLGFANQCIAKIRDSELDNWSFSFDGYSGELVFSGVSTSNERPFGKVLVHPYQDWDITYDRNADGAINYFKIKTEDGTIYEFGQTAYSNGTEITENLTNNGEESFITGFYLVRKSTPFTSYDIKYIYERGANDHYSLPATRIWSDKLGPPGDALVPRHDLVLSIVGTTIYPSLLKSISAGNDIVEFFYSSRTDRPGHRKLDRVEKRQLHGTTTPPAFSFTYQYSGNNGDRLFLKNVQFGSSSQDGHQAYEFGYDLAHACPAVESQASTDHYGYYNDKVNNGYTLPGDLYPAYLNQGLLGWGDKSILDASSQKVAIGQLTTVDWPTGLRSLIQYEQNKIAPDADAYNIEAASIKLEYEERGDQASNFLPHQEVASITVPWNILNDNKAPLKFKLHVVGHTTPSCNGPGNDLARVSATLYNDQGTQLWTGGLIAGQNDEEFNIEVPSGQTYKLVAIMEPTYGQGCLPDGGGSCTITYPTAFFPPVEAPASGVRVKTIKEFDFNGDEVKQSHYRYVFKAFVPETGTYVERSSGVLAYLSNNYSRPVIQRIATSNGFFSNTYSDHRLLTISSYPVTKANPIQGSHILYSEVEEVIQSVQGNHKNKSIFRYPVTSLFTIKNSRENVLDQSFRFKTPTEVEKYSFNETTQQYILAQKVKSEFYFAYTGEEVSSIKFDPFYINVESTYSNRSNEWNKFSPNTLRPSFFRKHREETTQYTQNGGLATKVEFEYSHPFSNLPSKTTTWDSRGTRKIQAIKRLGDVTGLTGGILLDAINNHNITSLPIEESELFETGLSTNAYLVVKSTGYEYSIQNGLINISQLRILDEAMAPNFQVAHLNASQNGISFDSRYEVKSVFTYDENGLPTESSRPPFNHLLQIKYDPRSGSGLAEIYNSPFELRGYEFPQNSFEKSINGEIEGAWGGILNSNNDAYTGSKSVILAMPGSNHALSEDFQIAEHSKTRPIRMRFSIAVKRLSSAENINFVFKATTANNLNFLGSKLLSSTGWEQISFDFTIPAVASGLNPPLLHTEFFLESTASDGILIDEIRLLPLEGHIKSYTYNDQGLISSICNNDGTRKHFEYNSLGNLIATRVNEGYVTEALGLKYSNQSQQPSWTWNLVPGVYVFSTSNLNPQDRRSESFGYFDGFARKIQSVSKQASPNKADLISAQSFNYLGQPVFSWLPFLKRDATGEFQSDGSFVSDATPTDPYSPGGEAVSSFWVSQDAPTQTTMPFGEAKFEEVPGGRLLRKSSQGEPWSMPAGKVIRAELTVNSVNQNLPILEVQGGQIVKGADYPIESLIISTTIDEDEKETLTIKDKEGNILCSRILLDISARSTCEGWATTLYVYDQAGRLRVVIPPNVACQALAAGLAGSVLSMACYQMEYDGRNRKTAAFVPGNGWTYFAYDDLDRLRAVQDPNLRLTKTGAGVNDPRWRWTKYDELDRPILQGEISTADGRLAVQQVLNNQQSGEMSEHRSNSLNGYSDLSWPHDHTPLIVNHYDDYDFNRDGAQDQGAMADFSSIQSDLVAMPEALNLDARLESAHGKITCTMDWLEAESRYLKTMVHFDQLGRQVQTRKEVQGNSLGITNVRKTVQPDIAGAPLVERTEWLTQDGEQPIPALTVKNSYDHASRLASIRYRLDEVHPADQILSNYYYDAVGKLRQIGYADGFISKHISSNVRGWPVRMYLEELSADPAHAPKAIDIQLTYETHPFRPRFSGDITSQTWHGQDQIDRRYDYTYDQVGRLLQGAFTRTHPDPERSENFDEDISYDIMGNITYLNRWGLLGGTPDKPIYGQTDALSYGYNQFAIRLENVHDGAALPDQLNPYRLISVEMNTPSIASQLYDGAGRLIQDLNLRASFQYDRNGLITTFRNDAAAESIQYIRNQSGQMLGRRDPYNSQDLDYLDLLEVRGGKPWAIHLPEGRLFLDKDADGKDRWRCEYHFRDHLSSLRMAFRHALDKTCYQNEQGQYGGPFGCEAEQGGGGENGQSVKTFATLEPSVSIEESQDYENLDEVRHLDANESRTGIAFAQLSIATSPIGPLRWMQVKEGDTVRLKAYAKYDPSLFSGSSMPFIGLGAYLSGLSGTAGEAGLSSRPRLGLTLTALPFVSSSSETTPNAYLRYIVYSSDTSYLYDGVVQVTENASGDWQELSTAFITPKEGFVQWFVANESAGGVSFDDHQDQVSRCEFSEEWHWYPYGLPMTGICREGSNTKLFATGTKEGPETWQDHGARFYDKAIGRWNAVDPLASKFSGVSGYAYSNNSPVINFDPNGKEWVNAAAEKLKVAQAKLNDNPESKRLQRQVKRYTEAAAKVNEVLSAFKKADGALFDYIDKLQVTEKDGSKTNVKVNVSIDRMEGKSGITKARQGAGGVITPSFMSIPRPLSQSGETGFDVTISSNSRDKDRVLANEVGDVMYIMEGGSGENQSKQDASEYRASSATQYSEAVEYKYVERRANPASAKTNPYPLPMTVIRP